MRINQYALFATVARHRSLTKASEELRISQPSVSQQLKQLEDRYGSKLYQRIRRGVIITEAGNMFLRQIAPILDQVERLENQFKPASAKASQDLIRVGGSFSASTDLLPTLLAGFRQEHPMAEMELRTRTSDQLERMVLTGVLDLAVTLRYAPSEELVCEPLRSEKIAMFVLADHPLANKARLQPSDVLAHPLIVRGGRGATGVTDSALKQIQDKGFKFKIAMYCDGPTSIKAAVRQGMGVGIAFEDGVQADVARGEFKILRVRGLNLAGESFIVYSKRRPLSAMAQEFLQLLRSHCETAAARRNSGSSRRALP